jgi:DNA-binding CsgD family transcriptional regulator
MKQRILTDREREEIKAFLAGKKSSTIVRMLKYRAKKFLPIIKEEIELLEKL